MTFPVVCLSEENEITFRDGAVHPIDNEAQGSHTRSNKAALFGAKLQVGPVCDSLIFVSSTMSL
jgi:hypothetical protein